MKIIHLTAHIGHGGDWTVIRSLMEVFQAKGHQVMIGGCQASSTKFECIEMPLNQGAKGFIQSLGKLNEIPKDTDILHTHNPISLLLAVTFKYLHCHSAKIIFTYHWETPDSKIKKLLKSSLFQLADVIHSHSIDINKLLATEYKIDKVKNCLAYVGCDSSRFSSKSLIEKKQSREKYRLSDNVFILLFVGRLSLEKNISLIFQYVKNQASEEITFLIAGDGPLKNELKKECQDLKIEDRVHFLGRVENIETIYSLADILVLPSSSMETFGMVVIEAAFCGLPTLRSDLPGASDQITHGEDGFIFPIEQPEKMFEILDQIWENRSQLPEIGQKARDRALENFTLEKMYKRFLYIYQK